MKNVFLFLSFTCISVLSTAQTPFFPTFNAAEDTWMFLDISGETALTLPAGTVDDLHHFSEGLAAAHDQTTHLWGFIDPKGNWVIQPQYERVADFLDGYTVVSNACKKGCYEGSEGLMNTDISAVINKKGVVVFTDKSQQAIPGERFFLDKNLGDGLFRIIYGYGLNDMKNIIDLKGTNLCETYSVFGRGDIEYDRELKVFKCWNKFYRPDGLMLDLSKYEFVSTFSGGYVWAESYQVVNDVEISQRYLIDTKGTIVLEVNGTDFQNPGPVTKGTFIYSDEVGAPKLYTIADKTSVPYIEPESGLDLSLTPGPVLKDGTRFLFLADDNTDPDGFVTATGDVMLKYPE